MGRHKPTFGKCRLCGEKTKLTFEHIPPQSTFNKNGQYIQTTMNEFFSKKNPLKNFPKGVIKQGGMGTNSLCSNCNNFLGINYVKSYKSWVLSGLEVLKSGDNSNYSFIISDIEPLNIIKQIFSMFISFGDEQFYENHTELCEFVRNPKTNNLSDRYQIFTYLNDKGRVNYIPPMGSINLKKRTTVFCTEITFPPFGYVFTIGSSDSLDKKLCNISVFKTYEYNEKVKLEFNMYKLPKHLPLPIDYRTDEEINDSLSGE